MAAFGLVRGGAQADMLQLSAGSPVSTDLLAQVCCMMLGHLFVSAVACANCYASSSIEARQ